MAFDEVAWEQVKTRTSFETDIYGTVYHSGVTCGKYIYVFGGRQGYDYFNAIYRLDYLNNRWTKLELHGYSPSGRTAHSATVADDKMIIIGGNIRNQALKDMHIFDFALSEWISSAEIRQNGPGPCNGHSADYFPKQDVVIVFNGYDGNEYCNKIFALYLETMKWRKPNLRGNLPAPRSHHGSCVSGNKLYIFGGYSRLTGPFNDLHVLTLGQSCWTFSSPLSKGLYPTPRYSCSLVTSGNWIYLFGGEAGAYDEERNLYQIMRYSITSNSWQKYPTSIPLPFMKIAGHSLSVVTNGLLMVGTREFFKKYHKLPIPVEE